MRIFVTGASGHLGLPTVRNLIAAGHSVVGLARSDESAGKVRSAGAEVRRGTLDDLDGLREAARAADGVIHLGFKHDIAFSGDFMGAVKADLDAVQAIGEALAGSNKPFANTTGTMLLAHSVQGRTVDTSHSVISANSDAGSVYVPLTRGRECNSAYAITQQARQDNAQCSRLNEGGVVETL